MRADVGRRRATEAEEKKTSNEGKRCNVRGRLIIDYDTVGKVSLFVNVIYLRSGSLSVSVVRSEIACTAAGSYG